MLEVLDSTGHTVTLAANGREGLHALDRIGRPCLVLLDVMMPELDGAGFLAELARRADLMDFIVVVISADPAQALAIRSSPRVLEQASPRVTAT
jgi:CheY-like chemotaxis protein